MPETTPAAKGPAPVQSTTETPGPAPTLASEVRPEEVAALSPEYRDGLPVLVAGGGSYVPARAGGGSYVPAHIEVIDGEGNPAAALWGWSRARDACVSGSDPSVTVGMTDR
ncbi:hypothetical protein [Streptomyces nojiriensis]|nr:hypothetical protein [Streptomyces nojiriensis]QTI42304.1 hypothetical protein JYK04_00061 [Streptomyces nojiriensis]